MAVTKAEIVTMFNSIVRSQLTSPTPGGAPWYSGNVPTPAVSAPLNTALVNFAISNHNDLGLRAEAPAIESDIFPSASDSVVAVTVFNQLHAMAMALTRVRTAQYVYYYSNPSSPTTQVNAVVATSKAALNPRFALYFPIPGGQVKPGTIMNLTALNNFLVALRVRVQAIRTNATYMHTFTASCHNSCHSSCHGSRGRR